MFSRRRDDGRPSAANEANVQNLARDRRAKPGREMQRRAVADRRQHGLGKRGIVSLAAARSGEHDPRLADNGAVAREAHANRDLVVVMRRTPAGGEARRDAMDARNQRPRLDALCWRAERQRENNSDPSEAASGEMLWHRGYRWNKFHLRRPTIVIASEAKQSRGTSGARRSLDCFVAALLAMTIPSNATRPGPQI